MTCSTHLIGSTWPRLAALGLLLALAMPGAAPAQPASAEHHPAPPPISPGVTMGSDPIPKLPGQDAFGAIQEIVQILDADPKTDWSKVDLEALRQHLIDMSEVTLKANETPKRIPGGLEIAVTGDGRTRLAIQRMVPDWAAAMSGYHGWTTRAAPLTNGELMTVTAKDPREVAHIRGLGFIGLLASGSHHQMHHLMMAKGEFAHDRLDPGH